MGKRAEHRTTRTISLDKETIVFLEKIASLKNSNVSNVIEELAKKLQKEYNEKKSKDK